jgi:hypothetical protein
MDTVQNCDSYVNVGREKPGMLGSWCVARHGDRSGTAHVYICFSFRITATQNVLLLIT